MSRPALALCTSLLLICAVTAVGLAYGHGNHPPRHHPPHYHGPGMYPPGAGMAYGPPGHRGWWHDGHRLEHLARRLDLDGEQYESVRAILERALQRKREIRTAMRDNRRALAETMHGGAGGPELERLAKRQGTLVTELIELRGRTLASIREALTEDQRARLHPGYHYEDDDAWY